MAFSGAQPSSTNTRAAIIPERPSPPRQWSATFAPARTRTGMVSPSWYHVCWKHWPGMPLSRIGRWNQVM
jgi:hypothetical protein